MLGRADRLAKEEAVREAEFADSAYLKDLLAKTEASKKTSVLPNPTRCVEAPQQQRGAVGGGRVGLNAGKLFAVAAAQAQARAGGQVLSSGRRGGIR